ncbi:MAG: hypothetical protein H7Y06_13330 [Opitutaceae bacterium]|nr:hypothetical protein [Opitutaceae bacterium]
MTFARSVCVALMIFVFGGVSAGFAQTKPTKVKITRQPVSVVAGLGQAVTFGVAYTSTTSVSFQWRLNKQPLEGETASTLVIDQVMPSDAGKYDVVITNGAGAAASKAATLTVNLAPASLAVDDVIQGSFTLKIAGESFDSDGAFIVTGTNTLQDPESLHDTYTFTYTRLPKNKATLVINGRFFESSLGGYITSVETHSLTFTGVAPDGRLVASDSMKGYMLPPIGYQQKKLNFSGSGVITLETEDSADLAYESSFGGSMAINSPIVYYPPISIDAITVDLSPITFGEGNAPSIKKATQPNYGSSAIGQVNFISNVSYNSGLIRDIEGFQHITIGTIPSLLPPVQ